MLLLGLRLVVSPECASIACQRCHLSRCDHSNVMLQCVECGRGCHQRCLLPAQGAAHVGSWKCPGCVRARAACGGVPGAQLMQRSTEPGCVIYVAGMFPGTTPDDYDGTRAGTDVACRRCGDRDAHRMLLCDACDHGFHMDCLGMRRKRAPGGLWFCPDCQPDAMTLAEIRTSSARRGARAHGACATAGA